MMVHEINDENFAAETATGLTVIDFWAPWCGPCKMQSPVIEEMAEADNTIKFCKLNVDDNKATASSLGIMSIPTLLIKKKMVRLLIKWLAIIPKNSCKSYLLNILLNKKNPEMKSFQDFF